MSSRRVERGDFQTPLELARLVVEKVAVGKVAGTLPGARGLLEPTCGRGSFLVAGLERFPAARALGVEIDGAHLAAARDATGPRAELLHADFFTVDWPALLAGLPDPLLVLGNPPWVTNATLGALGSDNLPPKRNFQGLRGLEARTGRSNFDVSEWMLIRLLEALQGRDAALALLVKTSVARRVLRHAWRTGLPVREAALYGIDAARWFGASVEACLLVCHTDRVGQPECALHEDLSGPVSGTLGLRDGELVADLAAWDATADLAGEGPLWRSGVKHDCAAVLELRVVGEGLQNGLGEAVDVEPAMLYPLLKGTDVARARLAPQRFLLLPAQGLGDDPAALAETAPRAWAYLCRHGPRLDARRSRIYQGRPRFSVFGVGDYTFAPWKVAVSGLHAEPAFRVVGPWEGRPVVFDDTVYFLACEGEAAARQLAAWLGSPRVRAFFGARIFRDAKRPVTAAVLRQLRHFEMVTTTP